MKKLFFSAALALGALFSFQANAQNYFVVEEGQNTFATISANNFTISATQSGTTYTTNPPSGGYSDINGPLLAVQYGTTPSIINVLYINVAAGKTLKIVNNYNATQSYAVRLDFYTLTNGQQTSSTFRGAAVNVGGGQTATLSIPTVTNFQYTSALPTYYDTYQGYPVIIKLTIETQS
ncbi:hypothetical protein [Chitinophaga sp.]|uniref:hypothetical protein n=1 Tax=Chitinophaga sp. TaxID=1869181 RepID=UPI0031DA82D2